MTGTRKRRRRTSSASCLSLSVASRQACCGEERSFCCRWAVPIPRVEVSHPPYIGQKIHSRKVPGYVLPRACTKSPAGASSLVGRSFSTANFNNVHCWTRLDLTALGLVSSVLTITSSPWSTTCLITPIRHAAATGPRVPVATQSCPQCLLERVACIVHQHMPNLRSLVERWSDGDDAAIEAVSICLSPGFGEQGEGIWTYRAASARRHPRSEVGKLIQDWVDGWADCASGL